ncbi:hypothetical protein [Natrinema salsiterrestre]|uniref:Uncharacterized protein n=1 Tax=Natrinema salsiterrestre TaxID=2950540 RepID=A0A9Q4Q086_9EURY|nr:hypothetical protein [Natrinema salsiterrestre]MDF9745544.1 hypothetical protein [Natrinema salsiterrestre]
MLDTVVELVLELGFDTLLDRNENRTLAQQLCLFAGLVFVLIAIALWVTSGPLYGLAAGVVALALLLYGA